MFKGIVLALVLMLVGDLTFNDGQVTQVVHARMTYFLASSADALHNSFFGW